MAGHRLTKGNCSRLQSEMKAKGWCLPTGSIVVPFWGLYLGFYKVIPNRTYYGAYGLLPLPPHSAGGEACHHSVGEQFFLAAVLPALHLHTVCKDINPEGQDPLAMVLQQHWHTAKDLLLNFVAVTASRSQRTAPPEKPRVKPQTPQRKETKGLGFTV